MPKPKQKLGRKLSDNRPFYALDVKTDEQMFEFNIVANGLGKGDGTKQDRNFYAIEGKPWKDVKTQI